MISEKIFEIHGPKPGPTLAIFAGVHGNELAGVLALQELLPQLRLTKGTVYAAYANPPAIAAKVRMINKNLNRCFIAGNEGTTPEDVRARELMAVLDKSDALLDLHMFYDAHGQPFVICEDEAVGLAQTFDVDIISTNWTRTEPGGSDGYMHLAGKIGICVECGPISQAEVYKEFAKRTVYQFLQHFGMTDEPVALSTRSKRIVRAQRAVYKTSADFVLGDGFRNFDALDPGQIIARDGNKTYTAEAGDCIIFPHYGARIGEEAYIIGTETAGSAG
ncbi:MAG TPA: succinylglutamate desuccinylase/aspartoacylase family protein [Candidatus Saccharimonadales bacterium]|nr:succinylglutamate desuccinylase/aspartoacylase family protein [Candidatus Saccharimonadales bacterium]